MLLGNIDDLYKKIKEADDEGNVILPKEYLKKFIIMNLLLVKQDSSINKEEIFGYLKDDDFELPSAFENLDKNKQEKYLANVQTLIKLFYLD